MKQTILQVELSHEVDLPLVEIRAAIYHAMKKFADIQDVHVELVLDGEEEESEEEPEPDPDPIPDSCPGCGKVPGEGLTEACNHSNGCGFWRQFR